VEPGIEHDFGKGWMFSMDYIGSHTIHIEQPVDMNSPSGFMRTLPGQARSVAAANATRPIVPVNNGYRQVLAYANFGSAFYDGLQVKLNKQLTNKLSLLLTYTWSHDINTVEWDGTGQNPNDYSCLVVCEKATSLLNQTNRASLSGTYMFPWQILFSAFAQMGSGFPYNVTTGVDNNGDGNTSDRPVVNGVVVPRDWGRAPALYDFDFALQKAFKVTERTSVSVRAESFNTFNHLNTFSRNGVYGNAVTPVSTFGQPVGGWPTSGLRGRCSSRHGSNSEGCTRELRVLAGRRMKQELAVFRCSVVSRDKMRRTSSRRISLLLRTNVCLPTLLWMSAAFAQSAAARGSISGTVTDPHGNAVAGAHVIVRNTDFTSSRDLVSNENGGYNATMLTPGAYTVEVKAQGFTLKKPARVTLGVGSSIQVDIRLGVALVSQGVTVTAHGPTVEGNTLPPAINKQAPEVSNTLAGLTVTYLPNRDRDFSQFGQLGAGVQPTLVNSGLVVDGQRPNSLAVSVDGADFTDPLNGGQRGAGDGSFFFPQTVVREFQIVHAGVSVEVSGTNAGFINIATKEGSNKYRGEAFYIGRPSAFTSPDTFGHSLDNTQNEFGGSIGGPIKKNRAFFYLGMEQDYLDIPFWTQFEPQAPGVMVPPTLAALQQQVVGKSDPTAVFARTDILLNKNNTLNLQFDYNRLHATNMDDGSTRSIAPIDNISRLTGTSYWIRGNLTSVIGAQIVNQVLAQWAQDQRTMTPNSITPEYVINGFGILGGNSLANWGYTSNISRFNDDLAIIKDRATLRVGGGFAYDPARQRHEANLNGRFDFDSLADFLVNDPRRYQQTFVVGDPFYDSAVKSFGLYVDAKLILTKTLTVTAGIRWDA
jgi:hypothetical protein